MKDYWTPADAGPAAVYHDVLIAYDEQRYLNNGQPSLWAFIFDKLNVVRGERVLHLGCGMGYCTAILAELVGPTGEVLAIEIDKPLAERAQEALTIWPQVTVANGDGADGSFAKCDVVVASAGATHPFPSWLECLKPKGRLVFTNDVGEQVGRHAARHTPGARRFRGAVSLFRRILRSAGARDAEVGSRLEQAFARDRGAGVRSVRTDRHVENETCWLHGDGWCVSRREPDHAQQAPGSRAANPGHFQDVICSRRRAPQAA
jgi:protein-L-isoaspartate(D-aspartate) O-methyltransferase